MHFCDQEDDCTNVVSKNANVIYLSSFRDKSWHVVPFENVEETQVLVKKVLENLPEPKDLDDKEFQVCTSMNFCSIQLNTDVAHFRLKGTYLSVYCLLHIENH